MPCTVYLPAGRFFALYFPCAWLITIKVSRLSASCSFTNAPDNGWPDELLTTPSTVPELSAMTRTGANSNTATATIPRETAEPTCFSIMELLHSPGLRAMYLVRKATPTRHKLEESYDSLGRVSMQGLPAMQVPELRPVDLRSGQPSSNLLRCDRTLYCGRGHS